MKPKIFVTRRIPQPALDRLSGEFEIELNEADRVLTKEEILKGTKNCDVLLCLLTDTIDEEIIKVNPKLKGIANYAVGYNNIDIEIATNLKIPVSNTPGVLTQTTADLTWSLILSVSRRIVESDCYAREGKFTGWGPMLLLGNDIFGKTLGIIGAGRIGTAVAERAFGFKMKILYTDNKINKNIETNLGATKLELNELLGQSDFITLHIPLNEYTNHLITKNELKLMKDSAIIINTSRGQIIKEKDLIKALQDNEISGAGLDVYEFEPKISKGLKKLKNVIILPHIGSATIETRTAMGMLATNNAIAMVKGKKPENIVNPQIYKKTDSKESA
ncbi:MAG: D-glycerate dehydrogenase [Candidatus Cloacimonetes bacterium]|nr:D-glycerate dehydrogenase [Candidatus Cloacimonadota bacterium]